MTKDRETGTGSEFRRLLDRAVRDTRSKKREFAAAIGVTPSAFSRLDVDAASIEVCLKIAQVGHVHPSRVLRAAGHDDVAARIESLYGRAAERAADCSRVSPSDAGLLKALHKIPKPARRHFEMLILLAGAGEDALRDLEAMIAKPTTRSKVRAAQKISNLFLMRPKTGTSG